MDEFKYTGLLWRLAFSLALVFLTFNPSGHSYYHWLAEGFPHVQPLEAIAGILLLGLWIFFVRSTLLAMGAVGVVLLIALFAAIVWWVVSQGWFDLGNRSAMAWIVLTMLGIVLGVGMSWSHLRRRISWRGAGFKLLQVCVARTVGRQTCKNLNPAPLHLIIFISFAFFSVYGG